MTHAHAPLDPARIERTWDAMSALVARFGSAPLVRVTACLGVLMGALERPVNDPLQRPERVFFPGLSARPFHDPASSPQLTEVTSALQAAYPVIRAEAEMAIGVSEGQNLVSYLDVVEADAARRREKFRGVGDADWKVLVLRGEAGRDPVGALHCPATSAELDRLEPHLLHRGDALFTILGPGARLPPHHDGCNYKLTVHLALVVPPRCALRVGGVERHWQEGSCLVFDDTYLHEAENLGTNERVCLLVDVWHPDLTPIEREAIRALIDASQIGV